LQGEAGHVRLSVAGRDDGDDPPVDTFAGRLDSPGVVAPVC
jgi:hypothetical protein